MDAFRGSPMRPDATGRDNALVQTV